MSIFVSPQPKAVHESLVSVNRVSEANNILSTGENVEDVSSLSNAISGK